MQSQTQKNMQPEAVSENDAYMKAKDDSSELEHRENGEYFRRKLAELDAVQSLAKLRMLQGHPSESSPPLGSLPAARSVFNERKKPIKFKDAVGRKFSFPFEMCCTWQVSNSPYFQDLCTTKAPY
jgi:hypothetical protein